MRIVDNQDNIQSLRKISSLYKTVSMEVDELLSMVIEAAREIVGAKNASLLMVQNDKTKKLQFYQASGKNRGQLKDIEIPPGVGIAGMVVKTGKPIISNDVENDPRWYKKVSEKMEVQVRRIACFPLILDKKTIGVVQFLDKHNEENFTEEEGAILFKFASLMAKFFQATKSREALGEEFNRLKTKYLRRYMIVGESQAVQKCISLAEKLADSKAAVLLTGESGT
ncbi:MAG: GAF domain-containing protein, partial [Nitrospinaceae bacterium]|nr:sigma-54-dependent Fis family transcriptional regulator [Nitrospinaceae bacterium]NIR56552.1 sigma-54-dependent Fis family transcriptional regulator [Nitrospinaceae bacterium]NIS87011.1 sigma-54-dependent Fis family transcriptional regulator [Nitrospinaceae bacterium]NIT83853.1 sigma-54-dependent Fis family transcriptional regulator [Nitrospinaceae bacterium]NIU46061.1 sigma-54-dependent Fis family transcriptional regulator [Nitrospinaceae bacterium]